MGSAVLIVLQIVYSNLQTAFICPGFCNELLYGVHFTLFRMRASNIWEGIPFKNHSYCMNLSETMAILWAWSSKGTAPQVLIYLLPFQYITCTYCFCISDYLTVLTNILWQCLFCPFQSFSLPINFSMAYVYYIVDLSCSGLASTIAVLRGVTWSSKCKVRSLTLWLSVPIWKTP